MAPVKVGQSIPERFEKHANKNWFGLSFNHKTTLTMGTLVPMACKQVYPGEFVKLRSELMMRFAALFLPIMHQCYFTWDWFYVRQGILWPNWLFDDSGFEAFMKQDPTNPTIGIPTINYLRSDAIFTDGVYNYMGFNAPPAAGTLIAGVEVAAMPAWAYAKIVDDYFRNPNIQATTWTPLLSGLNNYDTVLPDLRVLRRNWPRDYYTVATLTPSFGANVLIPSFATDPETGLHITQRVYELDGGAATDGQLGSASGVLHRLGTGEDVVLQLSSSILDLDYAKSMQNFLERHLRIGGNSEPKNMRWNEFVERNFDWNPNPLMVDRSVWIGGYTGDVMISDVMATAEAGTFTVGQYAGKAMVRDNTPEFSYTCPDYGYIIPILSVYPKASYYSGLDKIFSMRNKMDFMWEQFALIGDQPLRNKEVWFSWYDADIAWNDEVWGYVPQYHWERYCNDIVSGQMRTLWESFHLGRKFIAASGVTLNEDFIQCNPDIGRVFDVDAEGGEHECMVHSFISIEVLRRLPKFGLPEH